MVAAAVNAQVNVDAPTCWFDYSDCARESSGDESWRSVSYADFTACLGQKTLPSCPSEGNFKVCVDYVVECKELVEFDEVWAAQCSDDKDACELAHGC